MHSPLLQQPGRVINGMMHVVDWLPTLLQASQGNTLKYDAQAEKDENLDGIGMWKEISESSDVKAWPRQEVLLNIDPIDEFGGMIIGDHKLVYGHIPASGWYPPPTEAEEDLVASSPKILRFRPETEGTEKGKPITIDCGLMPINATKGCQPEKSPCLFNLREDPCEYHNVAADFPELVSQLQNRLKQFKRSMIPPGNKPKDPRGDPQRNGGVWKPWL